MSTDYTAAVITLSDLGSRGLREDTSGPALCEILRGDGWNVVHTEILPDDAEQIKAALVRCADEKGVCLVVTTGGTGFSPRDVTPEATKAVIERECPGAESLRITPRGCLSREVSGIRGGTLIVNCPGSEKAARECIGAVLPALKHGVEMLRGWSGNCAGTHEGHHHGK